MKKIKLTKGRYTLVDDVDFDMLNKEKWHVGSGLYACRVRIQNGKRVHIKMHRLIVNAQKNEEVDHINGDTLNNQRKNLRLCSHAQNMRNRKISKRNTSNVTGVYFIKSINRWRCSIKIDRKTIWLGYFNDKESAIIARKKAESIYFGSFSRK